MGEFSGLIMMFVFLLLLVVGGVAYALLSMYVKLRRIAAEREEKGSAGFVVDTFHGLVTQLKENERELEVLQLMAKGSGNKEIAASLFITESTIKTHVANIFQKLDVNRRTEAVTQALQRGIIKL